MRTRNFCWVLGLLPLLQTGCGNGTQAPEKGRSAAPAGGNAKPHDSGSHAHEAQHGGVVQSVGDFHLELVHDGEHGGITLYVMGSDGKTAQPIESKPFKLQVKLEDRADLVVVEMKPSPEPGAAQGQASRFAGTAAELIQARSFEVVVRIPIAGKIFRTAFQFVQDSQKSVYICPMGCENGKVYFKPGKCPVCTMDLVEPKSEHTDHASKHGGQLFMAPNKWHHLEGVMTPEREFRLYFYNNFTKPIPAQPFLEGSFIEVVKLDAGKNEIGKPARVAFDKVAESFLKATLPEGYSFPLGINARIKFEGQEKPSLFNFTFEGASEEAKHDH